MSDLFDPAPARADHATAAARLLLPAIAAVVVGGTAITGGVGSIWRTPSSEVTP
mgnify:CR=1 FL=1